MTALAHGVSVGGVYYPAGTDSSALPAGVADRIRNPAAWAGGTAPALTVTPVGRPFITMADLSSATKARASLGIEVDTSKGHLVPTGSAPTAAAQASAGTSATAAVVGHDTAGTITVTSGSASLATGNQVVVTFAQAYAIAPYVQLTPCSAAVAALHPYVAAASTTSFTVGFATAPSATTAYVLNYTAVGK